MTFPPPCTTSIDWNNVGFKVREVNGHIESRYTPSGKWSAPAFIRNPQLPLHGMCPGLNYGQQAFEGMKAFRSPHNTITIFRPDRNAARFSLSADIVSMPTVPEELFMECVNAAVAMNAEYVPPHETGAAMYIRPLLFGSSPQLGLNPPQEYIFCVFVMPTGVYHGTDPGKALIMEEFDRAAPFGTGVAKVGGNYAPVLRWSERAYKEGFGLTLHLDSKTRSEIDEFSTSGFIGVEKKGEEVKLVVPDSRNVLKSVTSESTLEIAKSLGWKTEARSIKLDQLSNFEEVFAAGTAAALVPIQSITHCSHDRVFTYLPEGSKDPGPIYETLISTLKGIQQGKVDDTFGWNCKITPVELRIYETGDEMNVSAKIELNSAKAEGTEAKSANAIVS